MVDCGVNVLREDICTVLFEEQVARRGSVGCGADSHARSDRGGREVIFFRRIVVKLTGPCVLEMREWGSRRVSYHVARGI